VSAGWQPSLGAVPGNGQTRFRVWAPKPQRIELHLVSPEERTVAMERDGEYATATVAGVGAGTRYFYSVDGRELPDPCSRSQPEGVHGPSEVVDPGSYTWRTREFVAPDRADLVIYECHIGTVTPEGTFVAAIGQLARLAALGVSAIEVMPVAAFPGRANWGYDGAAMFAPTANYGTPDDFRRFIDAAHGLGLAVILDVVFNHFGPSGNYTGAYADRYVTDRYHTPWGDAVNYDGRGSEHVREFVIECLQQWRHEYRIDGFRFDATFEIRDSSTRHILAEISDTMRGDGGGPYLIAESNENDVRYLRPTSEGGYGFDGVWADDFHHIVRNALHRERAGYLASYEGSAHELAAAIEHNFLYEGQVDPNRGGPRGTDARDFVPSRFVFCVQNHDQVGNRALGLRLSATTSLADYLTAVGLLVLLPQTPLLFMGQEFAAGTPFMFFTDHEAELGRAVTEGRRAEFGGFGGFADGDNSWIPDPQDPETFVLSKLRHEDARAGAGKASFAFHREALAIRTSDPVLRAARRTAGSVTALARDAAVLATIEADGSRRYVAANFGGDTDFCIVDHDLDALLTSSAPRFGGDGCCPAIHAGRLHMPGHSVAFLRPSGQG
jgi:maltooligosyltrehalose trehalohydrolase